MSIKLVVFEVNEAIVNDGECTSFEDELGWLEDSGIYPITVIEDDEICQKILSALQYNL